ncbi:uncharacterized protein BDW47DRAFT_112400 [Aspergillus candidus]|uniref:Uncharacterized protein n=1 Tax=Aspergillus candidus TaxID=41067 RepID=A0A2I2F140_ASPCN|nr:hypothetical protein BDW47DRAFT_112400 [Aspergillus candidus]PLB34318.1 hypothetical protein BDW47DRAFT_112400 [Aspergillus candidus]
MIIDPPPARHSLRHSEKRSSLRSTSSPVTKSERASTSSHSDAHHHRLVRKIGRISDSDRRSIASEISASEMSTFSGVASPQVEVVPVVVIPERRSSLKSSAQSSAPSSRDPSKVDSSRRSRRRSGSRTESLDQSRSRRRTRSPSSARSTQSAFGHPVVPPRSSSLSAPTSRNNSRSTSLTSESLRHHTLAMDAVPSQPQKSQKLAGREFPSTDVPRTQSILIGVEDMAHLHSPAVTATHPSFPSLSPGPIEINEAITVAFFPHNNESILLVDPQVREQAERQASQLYQETTEPRTPEMQMQCNAESPLVNPRSPPEPPACKVIPPTVNSATDLTPATTNHSRAPTILGPAGPHLSPAATNLTPTATNLSRTATNDTNPGPFRRVASARRPRIRPGSESFHSFIRSLSLRSAENRKAGQEIDHSLHPFWRPRRFWPESSEPEDDSPREESMRFRDTDPDNVISNSLGMPQQRVAFNGPPPPLSPHRPAPRPSDITIPYSAATNRHTVETSVFSPEAFRSQTSFHQDRFRSVSWWRLRLRLGNVRNLRKRLRRTFQKRAEGKREARREKLKQSIGEMKPLGSSTRGIAQWWHGLPDNS